MPRFAANLSWMLWEIPMLDRFAGTRGLGFEAVECQLPYDHPAEDLARACGDKKLRFVTNVFLARKKERVSWGGEGHFENYFSFESY